MHSGATIVSSTRATHTACTFLIFFKEIVLRNIKTPESNTF